MIPVIRDHISRDFHGMYRDAGGAMKYPFLTPGSKQYDDVLWDWDCWLSNVALRQVLRESGNDEEYERAWPFEQGSVQNYLDHGGMDGSFRLCLVEKDLPVPKMFSM